MYCQRKQCLLNTYIQTDNYFGYNQSSILLIKQLKINIKRPTNLSIFFIDFCRKCLKWKQCIPFIEIQRTNEGTAFLFTADFARYLIINQVQVFSALPNLVLKWLRWQINKKTICAFFKKSREVIQKQASKTSLTFTKRMKF